MPTHLDATSAETVEITALNVHAGMFVRLQSHEQNADSPDSPPTVYITAVSECLNHDPVRIHWFDRNTAATGTLVLEQGESVCWVLMYPM